MKWTVLKSTQFAQRAPGTRTGTKKTFAVAWIQGVWSVRLSLHCNFKQPVSEPYNPTKRRKFSLSGFEVTKFITGLSSWSNRATDMTEGTPAWTPPSTFHSHRVQGPIMSNLRNDTWGIYRLIICSILAKRTALLLRGPVNKILHAKAVYCFSSCFLWKSLVWIPHIIPYYHTKQKKNSKPFNTLTFKTQIWPTGVSLGLGLLGRWPHTCLWLQLFRCEDLDRRISSPWIFKRSVLRMLKLLCAQNTWNIMEHCEMCEKIKSTIIFFAYCFLLLNWKLSEPHPIVKCERIRVQYHPSKSTSGCSRFNWASVNTLQWGWVMTCLLQCCFHW